MGRKKKYVPKKWESLNEGKSFFVEGRKTPMADTSATMFESMLRSHAYCDLSDKQRILYVLCKAQYYGKKHPEKDYEEFEGNEYFYLNFGEVVSAYQLYTEKGHSRFYKDMKALEEHGFIEKVKSGQNSRDKNVYKFSEKWRNWEEEDKNNVSVRHIGECVHRTH